MAATLPSRHSAGWPATRISTRRWQDASLRGLMAALMDRETGPTLPPVPGIDLGEYKRTLIARFANPAIRDTVERVNTDAPLNVLVVPIMARLEMNGSVDLLALSLAGWIRRVRGVDEAGTTDRYPPSAGGRAAEEGRGGRAGSRTGAVHHAAFRIVGRRREACCAATALAGFAVSSRCPADLGASRRGVGVLRNVSLSLRA